MPCSFFRDTVTVLRPTTATKNGMTYNSFEHPTSHVLTRVQVTPSGTSRVFEGRVEQVTDRRTFRASYDADIESGDRVIFEGETYEIDGEVFHTKSPTGRVSSTRCTLVRWDG